MILEVQNGCFGYPKQPVILENINWVWKKVTSLRLLVQTALVKPPCSSA